MILKIIGETLFLYGTVCWLYVIVISFLREEWLKMPLTHLTLWLRTDTFGIVSFILSIIGFILWRVT